MRVSYKPQRGVAAAVVAMLLFIPEGSSTVLEVVSSLLFGSTASKPQPPKWPQIYTVSYEVSMPHLYLTQPQGCRFPVTVWYNGEKGRMRIEVLGGIDTVIDTDDIEYTLYPRINETRCGVYDLGPGGGPTAVTSIQSEEHRRRLLADRLALGDDLQGVLPDLTGWDYGGDVAIDGKKANVWQYQHKEEDKVSQYTFYVSESGEPLQFLMMGINYLTDGHFDEYIYDFKKYAPRLVWPSFEGAPLDQQHKLFDRSTVMGSGPFSPPAICKDEGFASGRAGHLTSRHPVAAQLHAQTPRVRGYSHEAAYHAFSRAVHQHGQPVEQLGRPHTHPDPGLYEGRLARFQATVERVRAHNADPTHTYRRKVHRWADWSQEEFEAVMLPNKARKKAVAAAGIVGNKEHPDAYTPLGKFKRRLPDAKLPTSVDWRGTGADPGVKDQGMCGSCFAFSATGTMEGVWYVSTGEHRSFSEQQIIDCSWNWGPNGCGGGDYQPVLNYVANEGGIALEQDYPYLSNNDFCRAANHSRPGKFKGFLEIEKRDEKAVMEAVYTLGPLAVAVDAEFESFRSYSEGVYDEMDCRTDSADLDHAVMLFGYGTTPDGIDYWLVRNSWAKFYGDDGYIKIKRGLRDCGISTDAVAAVVADEHVVPGMAERTRLQAVMMMGLHNYQ